MADGRTFSSVLFAKIAAQIRNGEMAPGSRIATQREIALRENVSRTVVREAMARLEGQGLTVARQGAGVFVADAPTYFAFQVTPDEIAELKDVLSLLELRIGVEAEMAAFAAARRNQSDIETLNAILDRMDDAGADPVAATAADFEFHLAIARASRNEYYVRMIDFLGIRLIPSRRLHLRFQPSDVHRAYMKQVGSEHRAIARAIVRMDIDGARKAARAHLTESLARHAELGDAGSGAVAG